MLKDFANCYRQYKYCRRDWLQKAVVCIGEVNRITPFLRTLVGACSVSFPVASAAPVGERLGRSAVVPKFLACF
jgi:hypothetical protein